MGGIRKLQAVSETEPTSPFGVCDGSGWILGPENLARSCECREQRTAGQIAEAQAQARLQVASDRERRLAEELTSASARLASLEQELSTLADADRSLAEQVAAWQLDLDARDATLHDTDDRLAAAEESVRLADEALTDADHTLDDVRRRAHQLADEMHHAELRFTELMHFRLRP